MLTLNYMHVKTDIPGCPHISLCSLAKVFQWERNEVSLKVWNQNLTASVGGEARNINRTDHPLPARRTTSFSNAQPPVCTRQLLRGKDCSRTRSSPLARGNAKTQVFLYVLNEMTNLPLPLTKKKLFWNILSIDIDKVLLMSNLLL